MWSNELWVEGANASKHEEQDKRDSPVTNFTKGHGVASAFDDPAGQGLGKFFCGTVTNSEEQTAAPGKCKRNEGQRNILWIVFESSFRIPLER